MNSIDIEAEYRKLEEKPEGYSVSEFVDSQVRRGEWIEDDGDYYLADEWATQYDEPHPYLSAFDAAYDKWYAVGPGAQGVEWNTLSDEEQQKLIDNP